MEHGDVGLVIQGRTIAQYVQVITLIYNIEREAFDFWNCGLSIDGALGNEVLNADAVCRWLHSGSFLFLEYLYSFWEKEIVYIFFKCGLWAFLLFSVLTPQRPECLPLPISAFWPFPLQNRFNLDSMLEPIILCVSKI